MIFDFEDFKKKFIFKNGSKYTKYFQDKEDSINKSKALVEK